MPDWNAPRFGPTDNQIKDEFEILRLPTASDLDDFICSKMKESRVLRMVTVSKNLNSFIPTVTHVMLKYLPTQFLVCIKEDDVEIHWIENKLGKLKYE